VSLALALCGYGAPFSANAAFKPLVAQNVNFAIGVNLDKEQAFKVVDAYANFVFTVLTPLCGGNEKGIDEARAKLASFKKDPFGDAPEDARDFLKRSGLRAADYHWAVLSMTDFEMVNGKPRLGGITLAVAGSIDLDKFVSTCRQEEACKLSFKKMWIEGETSWHVVPTNDQDVRDLKNLCIDPYITTLDDRLVLAATSREALVKQIRLYRGKQGAGDALCGFSASDGELMHLHLSGIGALLRWYAPRHELKALNQIIPNGDEILLGLEDFDARLTMRPDGMLRDSFRIVMASERDADSLRTVAKMG